MDWFRDDLFGPVPRSLAVYGILLGYSDQDSSGRGRPRRPGSLK